MVPVADINLDTHDVQVLRVDQDTDAALLLVAARAKHEGQKQPPGRTRWSFIKNLPSGLLGERVLVEQIGLQQGGGERDVASGKGGGGRVCLERQPPMVKRKQQQHQHQHQHQQRFHPEERASAAEDRRSDAEMPSSPTLRSTSNSTGNSAADDVSPARLSTLIGRPPTWKPPPLSNGATGEIACLGGVPSTLFSTKPANLGDLLEVMASDPGSRSSGTTPTISTTTAANTTTYSTTRTLGSSGLGVFCKRAVKAGDVIFEEEALLKVSRKEVGRSGWRSACVAAGAVANARISAIDLLQVVAFEGAPASVQARVLKLFTPDEDVYDPSRLDAWNAALDILHRLGALGPAPGAGGPGDRKHYGEGGGAGAGGAPKAGAGGSLDAERRSLLSKVLMICEANVFGEEDDAADGTRSLFELACRINHSCLPNCNYLVSDGRVEVRAIADVEAGAELFVSYLSFDGIMMPTEVRRRRLLESKFFECRCDRCDAEHDVLRGFRCPRCRTGTVYPPNPTASLPQQQLASSRVPGAEEADDDVYGDAVGVSPCTDCGRVLTARWFRSAEVLEQALLHLMSEDSLDSMALSDNFWRAVAQAYAAGVYLFTDHHLMCQLYHCMSHHVTESRRRRSAEAAYHIHQMLVCYDRLLRRPTDYLAKIHNTLAIHLIRAVEESTNTQVARLGLIFPTSSAGQDRSFRCAYADLVQTPHPGSRGAETIRGCLGLRSRADPDKANRSGCPVCGRRHGDVSRPVLSTGGRGSDCESLLLPATSTVGTAPSRGGDTTGRGGEAVGGEEDAEQEEEGELAWRLYLKDAEVAAMKAIQMHRALHGTNSDIPHDFIEILEATHDLAAKRTAA